MCTSGTHWVALLGAFRLSPRCTFPPAYSSTVFSPCPWEGEWNTTSLTKRVIMSNNDERLKLLRKLAHSNERLQWPAIYSSSEPRQEIQCERKLLVDRLRDLPLAS